MGKPVLAEVGQSSAADCLPLIGDAADEIWELVQLLASHIHKHGDSETALVTRGILHRINALASEIYTVAREPEGEHEGLCALLGPAGA